MKFRAKRLDNGKEVEWYYVFRGAKKHQIVTDENLFPLEIDPNTLAMATGQTDKNGTMIFGSVPVDGMGMSKGGDVLNCLTYNGSWQELNITKVRVIFKNGAFIDNDTEENLHDIIIPNPITSDSDYFIVGKQYYL